MSKANEPAFPGREDKTVDGQLMIIYNPGFSQRTYLAGQAMMGLCNAAGEAEPEKWNYTLLARCAIKAADALLVELEKTEK